MEILPQQIAQHILTLLPHQPSLPASSHPFPNSADPLAVVQTLGSTNREDVKEESPVLRVPAPGFEQPAAPAVMHGALDADDPTATSITTDAVQLVFPRDASPDPVPKLGAKTPLSTADTRPIAKTPAVSGVFGLHNSLPKVVHPLPRSPNALSDPAAEGMLGRDSAVQARDQSHDEYGQQSEARRDLSQYRHWITVEGSLTATASPPRNANPSINGQNTNRSVTNNTSSLSPAVVDTTWLQMVHSRSFVP